MTRLFLPVLAGTTRSQRLSIHAARLVAEIGETFEDIDTGLVDPMDFDLPGDGNGPGSQDPRFSEIARRADGFFIVTPEYNHSLPGSLKRMLDSEYANYAHKPVAFAGVSSGPWGGVRAIEALVLTTRQMGLIPSRKDVQFPKVRELFDENGVLQDDRYRTRIASAWTELIWLARVLKAGRDQEPVA